MTRTRRRSAACQAGVSASSAQPVHEMPARRVVDLAQELAVTSSTAVRMCNRLVRKGLVVREERPDDRRVAWITLTTAGRDLVGEATRRRRQLIAELVAGLSLTRPLGFASVVNALVEEAGEVPDSQWWQQWRDAGIRATPEGH